MVAAATEGHPGKAPDAKAATRETKLAVFFTQTKVDDKGRPVRDPESSSYLATFRGVEGFAPVVYAEARRRGSAQARQLVVLGDGGPWIWKLAGRHFPTATQIVDLYHAREHLHDIGALVAGALGDNHPNWLAERLAELDRGDIAALLAAARNLALPDTKATALEKALNYFETNASC